MIQQYLAAKASISRVVSLFDGGRRAHLPFFISARELAEYMLTNLKYVSDPANGALDFYTHPGRTQWEVNARSNQFPCDCDDYATYAHKALSVMPGYEPRIITLLDRGVIWSHVVCGFKHGPEFFMIDTNGLFKLGVCETRLDEHKAILVTSSGNYPQASYFAAVETPYPFRS